MLAKGPVQPSTTPTMPMRLQAHRAVFIAVVSLLLLSFAAAILGVPVARSRDIAFYVNGSPVTEEHVSAMIVDLPFDTTSEFYNTRADIANPSDPKTQYLVAGLKKAAIERLVVMHAQSEESMRLGVVLSPSAVDAAVEAYVRDHALPGDTAETQRLRSPDMRSYIELWATSKAYEDSLTTNAAISPEEIREYFATWGWNYTDAAGRQLTFEQAETRLAVDSLANKKFQLILQDRAQLLKKEITVVSGDTRYKQFMRWWDIMFGIQVPDSLQPLEVDTGS